MLISCPAIIPQLKSQTPSVNYLACKSTAPNSFKAYYDSPTLAASSVCLSLFLPSRTSSPPAECNGPQSAGPPSRVPTQTCLRNVKEEREHLEDGGEAGVVRYNGGLVLVDVDHLY
eukprot:superscaffoldBa00007513_g22607